MFLFFAALSTVCVLACGATVRQPIAAHHQPAPADAATPTDTPTAQATAQVYLPGTSQPEWTSDQTVQVYYARQGQRDFTETRDFRAIVEQTHAALRIVILGPSSIPAMIFTQHADGHFEEDIRFNATLPFSGAFILRDIQRALYADDACNPPGPVPRTNSSDRRIFPDGTQIIYTGSFDLCRGIGPSALSVITQHYRLQITVNSWERLANL